MFGTVLVVWAPFVVTSDISFSPRSLCSALYVLANNGRSHCALWARGSSFIPTPHFRAGLNYDATLGLVCITTSSPRLAPWAAFLRRFAALFCYSLHVLLSPLSPLA